MMDNQPLPELGVLRARRVRMSLDGSGAGVGEGRQGDEAADL